MSAKAARLARLILGGSLDMRATEHVVFEGPGNSRNYASDGCDLCGFIKVPRGATCPTQFECPFFSTEENAQCAQSLGLPCGNMSRNTGHR